MTPMRRLVPLVLKPPLNPTTGTVLLRRLSSSPEDKEWNTAWESAWLPDDVSPPSRAPWESDVHFPLTPSTSSDMDSDTKAFVQDMAENWDQRKGKSKAVVTKAPKAEDDVELRNLEIMKRDYRLKKQRIHAGLWVRAIQKLQEEKLGFDGDNIDNMLNTASEIFDSSSDAMNNSAASSELKNKPDGWETMSKAGDGNVWEMSQREEDILLQEFERRLAFNKFKIASFIKTHIFSRRRPIDGWKYMIELIGPNSRGGHGSAPRIPSVADEATQPFREERTTSPRILPPRKRA